MKKAKINYESMNDKQKRNIENLLGNEPRNDLIYVPRLDKGLEYYEKIVKGDEYDK